MNNQQPRQSDVVIGGNTPNTRAVLGGLEGARARWNHAESFEEKLAVIDAIMHQYNQLDEARSKGVELIQQELARKEEIDKELQLKIKTINDKYFKGELTDISYFSQLMEVDHGFYPSMLREVFKNVVRIAAASGESNSYPVNRLLKAISRSFAPSGISIGWVNEAEKATTLLVAELSGEHNKVAALLVADFPFEQGS